MTEVVVPVCSICHYPTLQDDIAVETEHRHTIICERCYRAHSETAKPMPRELRKEVERLLGGLG